MTPFPQLLNGATAPAWNAPLGFSTYHGLQVQLNKRYSSGLSWLANYTFSKAIANVNNIYAGGTGAPIDANNLSLQKSIASYDQPHVVKVGVTYELPVGKSREFGANLNSWADAVVGGWRLSYIGNYSSGTPLTFPANSPAPGTNLTVNRAQLTNHDGVGLGIPFDSSKFNAALVNVGNTTNAYLNTQYIKHRPRTLWEIRHRTYRRFAALLHETKTSRSRKIGRLRNVFDSNCGRRRSMLSTGIPSAGIQIITGFPLIRIARLSEM